MEEEAGKLKGKKDVQMEKHRVAIRPNLRVMLDEETGIVVERTSAPGTKMRMSFREEEWREIADWVKTVNLLANGHRSH